MTDLADKLVIYHGGGCRDGFCCAWLMNRDFPGIALQAANYGEPPPDVSGKHVILLDFSYKRPVMEQLINDAKFVVVLDHHKTAQAELADLTGDKCQIWFDMTKSGARMTLDWLMEREAPLFRFSPWLVDYTEDRDLWLWKLHHSQEINAALRSYPLELAVWNELATRDPLTLVPEGQAILRAEQQIVDAHVRNAMEVELDGHKVLCVNATTLHSEIGGALAKDRPFGVTYFINDKGQWIYSLRSRDNGVDVSIIAKRRGGGGHRGAAGFQSTGVAV